MELGKGTPVLLARPPIGFVVEGQCEYVAYPSFVHRIVQTSGFRVPRVNAAGSGSVVRNLREHLTDLVQLYHPHAVIVTMDRDDEIASGQFQSCKAIVRHLRDQIARWTDAAKSDSRLMPAPATIRIVIQVRTFESWLLADFAGLAGSAQVDGPAQSLIAVDETISNPAKFLGEKLVSGVSLKSPAIIKELSAAVRPEVMARNSRSFEKFSREVRECFETWLIESS